MNLKFICVYILANLKLTESQIFDKFCDGKCHSTVNARRKAKLERDGSSANRAKRNCKRYLHAT